MAIAIRISCYRVMYDRYYIVNTSFRTRNDHFYIHCVCYDFSDARYIRKALRAGLSSLCSIVFTCDCNDARFYWDCYLCVYNEITQKQATEFNG